MFGTKKRKRTQSVKRILKQKLQTIDPNRPKYHNHYQPIGDVLGNEQNNKRKRKSLTEMFGTKKKKSKRTQSVKRILKQKLQNYRYTQQKNKTFQNNYERCYPE